MTIVALVASANCDRYYGQEETINTLKKAGYQVIDITSKALSCNNGFDEQRIDLLVIDSTLPHEQIISICQDIHQVQPKTIILVADLRVIYLKQKYIDQPSDMTLWQVVFATKNGELWQALTTQLSHNGYMTTSCVNWNQIELQFECTTINLAVIDIDLNEQGRLMFDRILKLSNKRIHTGETYAAKLFVSSAQLSIQTQTKNKISGADAYIESIHTGITMWFPEEKITNESVDFKSKNWVFDVDTFKLTAPNGHAETLSQTEGILMWELLRAAPGPATREALISALGGKGPCESYDHRLDVNIKRLRDKIAPLSPGKEIIITRRGVGYFFSEPCDLTKEKSSQT